MRRENVHGVKFRMYIDETGDDGLRCADDPRHRFLSLTGVIIDLGHVSANVYPEMERLKARYFGSHPDEPIIFHRKELVNRRYPFHSLRDGRVEREFNRELLNLMREWEYAVATVCLDKKGYADPRPPYHRCMAILLDVFARWLRIRGAEGDVMAEERGGREDMRTKEEFRNLWLRGTDATSPERIQAALTSGDLKTKSKPSNIAGLQLADMIAHPSRNEILRENGLLERPLGAFAEAIVEILKTKYVRDSTMVWGKNFT